MTLMLLSHRDYNKKLMTCNYVILEVCCLGNYLCGVFILVGNITFMVDLSHFYKHFDGQFIFSFIFNQTYLFFLFAVGHNIPFIVFYVTMIDYSIRHVTCHWQTVLYDMYYYPDIIFYFAKFLVKIVLKNPCVKFYVISKQNWLLFLQKDAISIETVNNIFAII